MLARINPRAKVLQFQSRQLSQTFHKNLDMKNPSKGWVQVSPEEAAYLRKQKDNGRHEPHAPPLFDVCTQDEAIELQQREFAKLGIGNPDNPIGGNPVEQAKIRQLEAQVDSMRQQMLDQNAQILTLLRNIPGINPNLAESLKQADPSSIGLALRPAVEVPAPLVEQAASSPVTVAANSVPVPTPTPKAPAAQTAPAAPKKPRVGANAPATDSGDLVSRMKSEGKITSPKGDIEDSDMENA